MEYSDTAKWFYNKNEDIVFSPSIRLFVISILRLKRFNDSGTKVMIQYAYSDYKHEIARMDSMGYWQLKTGLTKIVPFSLCCYNLTGYPIKIIYMKVTAIRECTLALFASAHFSNIAKLEAETTGAFGGLDHNNKPVGLFKFLAKKQADIVLSSVAFTEDRRTVADFTVPVFNEHIIGIYKPPDIKPNYFWSFYMKPFTISSWIFILTMILFLMMFSVMLMKYFSNAGVQNYNEFDILAICGLLLNQGSSQDHTSVGWRLYYWSVALLGTLLVTFYSSRIVAENAVFKHSEFFNNFYEVANHPVYRPIIWKESGTHRVLKSSPDPEASALWNRMKKDINHHTVTSKEETIELLGSGLGVFIGIKSYINYLKSENPSLVILDSPLGSLPMGIALQKNSPLTRMFNTILNDIHEGGLLQHMENASYISSSKIKENKIFDWLRVETHGGPQRFIENLLYLDDDDDVVDDDDDDDEVVDDDDADDDGETINI
ncbi:putative glutamate receptor [Nymphon striatum]|nr:putative glutamate receptor [Nymphon striatum]